MRTRERQSPAGLAVRELRFHSPAAWPGGGGGAGGKDGVCTIRAGGVPHTAADTQLMKCFHGILQNMACNRRPQPPATAGSWSVACEPPGQREVSRRAAEQASSAFTASPRGLHRSLTGSRQISPGPLKPRRPPLLPCPSVGSLSSVAPVLVPERLALPACVRTC